MLNRVPDKARADAERRLRRRRRRRKPPNRPPATRRTRRGIGGRDLVDDAPPERGTMRRIANSHGRARCASPAASATSSAAAAAARRPPPPRAPPHGPPRRRTNAAGNRRDDAGGRARPSRWLRPPRTRPTPAQRRRAGRAMTAPASPADAIGTRESRPAPRRRISRTARGRRARPGDARARASPRPASNVRGDASTTTTPSVEVARDDVREPPPRAAALLALR